MRSPLRRRRGEAQGFTESSLAPASSAFPPPVGLSCDAGEGCRALHCPVHPLFCHPPFYSQIPTQAETRDDGICLESAVAIRGGSPGSWLEAGWWTGAFVHLTRCWFQSPPSKSPMHRPQQRGTRPAACSNGTVPLFAPSPRRSSICRRGSSFRSKYTKKCTCWSGDRSNARASMRNGLFGCICTAPQPS